VRLLRPVSRLYAALIDRRMTHTLGYRSRLPVICIGNFTAGGTGKTPLALLVGAELKRRGHRPAFLTRGYGGRHRGPRWVDGGLDTAADVGDEALLLARMAQTLVARDRASGARVIEAAPEGFTAIVMDDGLQNPTLVKDLSIAVVDSSRGLGNGEVFPAGPLRAPLDLQLGLTDAIVVNGASATSDSGTTAWLRQRFQGPVLAASPAPAADIGWVLGARIVAYAGIVNPQRFFKLLEELGATVVDRAVFKDHHPYSDEDAARLLDLAGRHEALLATTEKDWVRLLVTTGQRRALREASRTIPISLKIDRRDEDRLAVLLDTVLASRAQGSAVASP
jgi:tetraacyldisaccharide 4'-kinase